MSLQNVDWSMYFVISLLSDVLCNSIQTHAVMYCQITKLWEGNVFTPVCYSVHRGLCPGRVSVQGVSVQGDSVQGISVQGIFIWEVSVPGSLSRGVCPGGLCPGDLCQGDPPYRMVKSERYTSHWNAFLFELVSRDMLFCIVRCILN